jgi:hypothetical protein
MLKIKIAERFHPFSHENGTPFLLPNSSFSVQVFPTRLNFIDLDNKLESFFLSFDFVGPLTDFTVELDLEQGLLRVFGVTKRGYMRYLVVAKSDGIWLLVEKIPEEKLLCCRSFPPAQLSLAKGESLLISLPFKNDTFTKNQERLSLGMHKAQEWACIRRRLDFKEIFPLWLALSHWTPLRDVESYSGSYALLEECRQRIEHGEKLKVLKAFKSLFLAAFDGVLVPRLVDAEYQGILPETMPQHPFASPLPLLTEGARLIRSLFVHGEGNLLVILPCLPPEFHSGRMIGVQALKGTIVDFEWTKKSLRRLQIVSLHGIGVVIKLPKGMRSCRVKKGRQVVKKLSIDPQGCVKLSLVPNERIEIDRFEK